MPSERAAERPLTPIMRILHVDKFLHASEAVAGGVGQYIRTLRREFLRRGHEVEEFGCRGDSGPEDRPVFEDFSAAGAAQWGRLLYNPAAAEALRRFLRDRSFDVVHLHNVYHHLTASILPVLSEHGAGVVMTVHDYRQIGRERLFWQWGRDAGGPEDEFFRQARPRCAGKTGWALRLRGLAERAARWYARWVDVFLSPTKFLCGELRRWGAPRGKIVHVPVPVEFDDFSPPADDGKTLLFVGRLSAEKAPDRMLDLAQRLPSARVVLLGEGPLRAALEDRRRREGLSNVELLGQTSREEVLRWYTRAAAVVLTSRCLENSPLAMLEAMAYGRCVIVPDQLPLREWVVEGQTGRCYRSGDRADLVRVAAEALADAAARRAMGAEAQRRVRREHDGKTVADRIEHIYEEARRRCALR